MSNLNVTYDEMRDAANRLKSAEEEINSRLGQLKRMVDSLVAGGYVTDQSSKAFDASYNTFNQGATQTISGLDGISSYLTQAADTLQQTDAELAKAAQK